MTFGELLAIRTADHGQVGEGRRGIAESLVDEHLTRGIGEMVIATDDVRHLHVHVIADDREVIGGCAVAAHEDHVIHEGGIELGIAVDDVVHDDGAAIFGHLETPHMGLARIDAPLGLLAAQAAGRDRARWQHRPARPRDGPRALRRCRSRGRRCRSP